MVFIFQFVNVVYYIDRFVDIKESLHSWDKARLVTVYDFFLICCWILFARILLRIFALCSSLILACNFLLFVASSSGFDIRVMVTSWSKFRTFLPSAIFWKSLNSIGVSSSLNLW